MVDLSPFDFMNMEEQVWLQLLPDGGFKVCCIPFRAYGLTLGDIVELDSDRRNVARVQAKGGHRAFRVFFPPELREPELGEVRIRVDRLIQMDSLAAEWSGDRHVAIDVPPGREISRIRQDIQPEVESGKAFWEWADVEGFRTSRSRPRS